MAACIVHMFNACLFIDGAKQSWKLPGDLDERIISEFK